MCRLPLGLALRAGEGALRVRPVHSGVWGPGRGAGGRGELPARSHRRPRPRGGGQRRPAALLRPLRCVRAMHPGQCGAHQS